MKLTNCRQNVILYSLGKIKEQIIMLDKELTNKVKFHPFGDKNLEWIEYPADSYIAEDTREKGYFILCCANILKDQPTLVQELKELYGQDVDVLEKWIRIEVLRTPTGKLVKQRNIVHNCTPPIIKEGFTHSLSFRGTDKNYLEFIKWDIEKKLAERQKLANLDVKIEEPKEEVKQEEPSFKIEGGEHKGDVEVPDFLTAESTPQRRTVRSERPIDAIFDDMERIMDDFFKGFPKNF